MFGSDMIGQLAGSFFARAFWKWLAILGGVAAIGYIGYLKADNYRLGLQVNYLTIDLHQCLDQIQKISEENEGLRIISNMTMEQCEGIIKFEREKPSRPGADTPITEEYLNSIFKTLKPKEAPR